MQGFNSDERVEKMRKAILKEANDKAQLILENGNQQNFIQKNALIKTGKEQVDAELKAKMDQEVIQQRIQQSSQINSSRITKMQKRFEMCSKLKGLLRERLEVLVNDPDQYKPFLRNCIMETLLKIMDSQVQLIVRKEDEAEVESMLPGLAEEFTRRVHEECKKQIDLQVSVRKDKYLEECKKGCIGGVVGTTLKGRIQVNNTLQDRIELGYQEFLPDIRKGLFPDYK